MATSPHSTTFYVYALARPNGTPFYIGKGTKRRVFAHENEAKSGHECHKCRVIRKVWREGGDIQRYILFTTSDEQDAFSYETEMIALHGRENLTNKTDGGEGVHGLIVLPETVVKRSEGMKRAWRRPGYHERVSAAIRAAKAMPEVKAHARAIGQSLLSTPEQRKAKSEQMLRVWNDPEWRARQLGRLAKANADPNRRRKISDAGKGRSLSAETRAKISAAHMGSKHNVPEETRRRFSEALRGNKLSVGRLPSEETRTKMSAAKARTYLVVLPSGKQITIPHLKTFCRDHELNYGSFKGYIKEGKTYKGYFATML